MKPAKGVLNKKQKICDDASTPAIKRFFKSAPKSFVINDKPNNHGETSSRDFYIQVLKEKLQGNLILNQFCPGTAVCVDNF